MKPTCLVEACGRQRKARGYCDMHYRRVLRHGDPTSPGSACHDAEESFLARTEPLPWSGCLIWTGFINEARGGYGQMSANGKRVAAHRYSWEREHGPIPEGMVIDHRYHCDRACVEPSHLRLATPGQNQWNRAGANPGSATGVRNVRPAPSGRYQVLVAKGGKDHYGGTFDTIQEAEAAAAELRKSLHEEFAS